VIALYTIIAQIL